jgi:hypothetical protein
MPINVCSTPNADRKFNALVPAAYAACSIFHRKERGRATTGVAKMPPINPTSSVITDQLTRALGEAVIRIWSNLPQEVQDHLFKEAVASQGESIRSQLAVFLRDKHSRTADPLGKPREMPEPDKPWGASPLVRNDDGKGGGPGGVVEGSA